MPNETTTIDQSFSEAADAQSAQAPAPIKIQANDAAGYIQNLAPVQKLALFGLLLEALPENAIVDRIILHKLTREVHEISRLLNDACRKRV